MKEALMLALPLTLGPEKASQLVARPTGTEVLATGNEEELELAPAKFPLSPVAIAAGWRYMRLETGVETETETVTATATAIAMETEEL